MKYRVQLTEEEQQELRALVSKGRAAAYKQTHARILLLSDENQAAGAMKDDDIARSLKVWHCHRGTGAPPLRGRGSGAGLGGARRQLNRRQKRLDGQRRSPPDCLGLR